MTDFDPRIDELLISSEEVEKGCMLAAQWINKKYKNKKFLMVGILKGCIPFIGKLISQVKPDVLLDFMTISSFKGQTKAVGAPKIVMDLATSVKDQHVLLVEDVVDTGNTIKLVLDMLKLRGAKSVSLMTFVDKPTKRQVDVKIDYSCYKLPDKFLVGFGLDYQGYLRNLPFIGTLKRSVYEPKGKAKTKK
ncbi:hypoxanthine phosphoribosyltransferase [[Mycoplasma] testudinis]|uniref:hypoxanthine phosphoribosyltransferase n=1 Tax=[Mycoplasma] testudinis TaxID=33924 RepID=UPI000488E812|nr:hypoxanthine phosphoribosyltransferase [[Mycoplasma] testudinis]